METPSTLFKKLFLFIATLHNFKIGHTSQRHKYHVTEPSTTLSISLTCPHLPPSTSYSAYWTVKTWPSLSSVYFYCTGYVMGKMSHLLLTKLFIKPCFHLWLWPTTFSFFRDRPHHVACGSAQYLVCHNVSVALLKVWLTARVQTRAPIRALPDMFSQTWCSCCYS